MGTGYGYNESKANSTEIRTGTSTDSTLESSKPVTGTDYSLLGDFKRAQDVSVKNTASDPIPVTITDGLLAGVTFDHYARVLSGGDSEIETWTYRLGGSPPSLGSIVAVVVATYTDNYRDDLVSVDRTT